MPADPVVSPADTLRRELTAYLPDGFRDEDGVWHDGPVLQDALAALDALLAVGERDRRQIARLTAALKYIAESPSHYKAIHAARAVLAGEEDAQP